MNQSQNPLLMASILGVLALPFPAGPAGGADVTRVLDRCPGEAHECVRMTVSTDRLRKILVDRSPASADGFTDFTIAVRGSLDGGTVRSQKVIVRGFTDGIECTAFGQSTAAVVGISEDSRAAILTSRGKLLLEPKALLIGCPQCVPPGPDGAARVSPAWDRRLTQNASAELFETHQGQIAITSGDGCIVMGNDFVWHPASDCAAMRTGQTLQVKSGACS